MKKLILLITLILSINVSAQNDLQETNVFVRVYDLEGKKISKGKILSISETSLQLKRRRESVNIPLDSIALIKTKRSAGHNILFGAVIGTTVMALIGVATADPDAFLGSADIQATMGAIFGAPIGAVIGAITALFKNSKSYEINGDKEKWKAFKETVY